MFQTFVFKDTGDWSKRLGAAQHGPDAVIPHHSQEVPFLRLQLGVAVPEAEGGGRFRKGDPHASDCGLEQPLFPN